MRDSLEQPSPMQDVPTVASDVTTPQEPQQAEVPKGRPYCTYVWQHKGRYFTCGYRAVEDQRCSVHAGQRGELRPNGPQGDPE